MTRFFLCLGIVAIFGVLGQSISAGTEGTYETTSRTRTTSGGALPTFTLNQAILTAVQRNPTLLNAEQEIKRSRGVIIQVRAQALPQINANANFQWTDPNLIGARVFGNTSTTSGSTPSAAAASLMEGVPSSQVGDVRTPLAAATPNPVRNVEQSDISYAISVTGTQLIFNGTTFNQIRGTFFQRDSAYFAFRNVLDSLIATVKTQFYQIIVNRELVKVNEENVHLLEAQLKDQQNRFEAGTVPRFNVLQADVQLHNQIPQLITAENNLRISKLQLAKTLGLDFQRRRGDSPPLEVIGDMPYIPRPIELADAIEMGKQRRPFLKQGRANVLNQLQQVRAAAGQYLPSITTTGGGEWVSSPINSSWHELGGKRDTPRRARHSDFPVFKRLAHHFQRRSFKLRQLIQEKDAVMREAYFARIWKRAAAEQTDVADSVMRRTKRSDCDKGLFGVEQPSNAVDLCRLDRFFERERRDNCWDPFGQH